ERKQASGIIAISSLLVMGINLYVFQYSGSRTGLLACVVYIMCNFWLFWLGKTRMFEKLIIYLTFPMACFLTIIVPLTFPGYIVNKLNDTVFMGRYWLDQFFWKGNRPVLWGQRLVHLMGHGMTYGLDSAQMYLFLQLGLVAFGLISVLTVGLLFYSIKANDLPELAVMETMLFIGLWEPLLYNLSFKNFSFVFMGYILYEVIEKKGAVQKEENIELTDKERQLGKIITDVFSIKKVLIIGIVSLMSGLLALVIYQSIVQQPSALYGSREQGENGESLGMEALYLTEEEINTVRAEGDLVVGYVDDNTPMYRYDENIAMMEYQKNALSVGVWSGLVVAVGCMASDIFMTKRRLI
ncbi:MAG: hypothetical protein J6N21_18365, partial [Butyrivibrio sp.]|nr:hypothetical protein [Butyrivibrio sp.]